MTGRPVFLLAAMLGVVPSLGGAEKDRPNILFCFADDWGRLASIYARYEKDPSANQVIRTPNIDRVAKEGVLFRRAFVNAPSCTPCRSSLLTGRYFFQTGRGAILRGAIWDPEIPSFPLLLRAAGYHIGKTTKVWSPGRPNDAPFDGQKHAYEKHGTRFNNFSEEVTKAMAKGSTFGAARDMLLAEVRNNFRDFLQADKEKKPFFYWFGPTTVHRAWERGSGQALWGIEPDSLKGKLPPFLPDVPEVREDYATYLGEIQAFDAYVGVLLQVLEEAGLLESTIIVLSGDHGPPGFPRGKCNLYDFGVAVTLAVRMPGGKGDRVVDDFVNLMDLAPTFLEMGGAKMPQGVAGKSIWPLLKSDKSGQVDPQRNYVVVGRERHVDFARKDNLPYPQRALRNDQYLYIRNFQPERSPMGDEGIPVPGIANELVKNGVATFADMDGGPTKDWLIAHKNDPRWKRHIDLAFGLRPGEELYDLARDPHQVDNVAADPAYAAAKARMSDELMRILREQRDPRVAEGECLFDRPPFTDLEPRPAKK